MSFISILETLLIGPLKLLFEIIFEVANKFVKNPGLSIIVLSLVMNILVLPLYKRADAMQEESRDIENKLSRGVNHIKKMFTGDERMMILQTYYRQNNYKPTNALKGSTSLLLEIPFFMAAYQFLSHLEALRNVSLGPIADLSKPDGLIVIGSITINLLPVLMTAVNVISSAIYLKGFPLKTKIQLYGMAAFFLVFLYTSPSGLVFYWTLNNLFSLAKNIFYKIKNPSKVISVISALVGVLSIYAGFTKFSQTTTRIVYFTAFGILLMLPLATRLLKSKFNIKPIKITAKPNKKIFVLGSLFLTVLIGLMIPATFIAASPQEYVDITYFHNPIWYIVGSVVMAAGFFLVWFRVFYWLANDTVKVIFDRAVWIFCGMAVINYMFFGLDLGIISAELVYETGLVFTTTEKLLNLLVVAAIVAVFLFVSIKWSKIIPPLLLTASIALTAMSGLHIYTTAQSVSQISTDQADVMPNFNLNKNGKNVIVLMLDRAVSGYLPYYMEEKPILKDQFAGFTYYDNTISFGGHTNFCTPSLFGGYEYTPVEINKRDTESLAQKQNEALKIMPVLFSENGYDVTVCDPVYANYQWISDTSIYDEYENIDAFVTEGKFSPVETKIRAIEGRHRNFFCFSLMKSFPLVLQPAFYDNGTYNHAIESGTSYEAFIQSVTSPTTATGVGRGFTNAYYVLENLPNITNVTDSEQNTFLMMANNATHEISLLQRPDYSLAYNIDNTEYDAAHPMSATLNGRSLKIETVVQAAQYQSGMAAMLRIGEWFDYMREQGVFDNTRIIVVADHGFPTYSFEDLQTEANDFHSFNPLLMIKDFGSTEFTTSHEFMTNADVPTLAMKDNIENPVNPFTNKPINNSEKTAHKQYLPAYTNNWDIQYNNGNTYTPERWIAIENNIFDIENHLYFDQEIVLKEHKLPNE